MKKKRKSVSYAKWGYIFILPFFICFLIFSLIPLIDTVRYSFFEYYRSGIKEIGPNFIGMQNYISLLESDMFKYAGNTLILWIIGFVPQIVVALLLANWFSDVRLKIRGKQFFKVVIYLPNLIMASAFAMLFFAMFSTNGPINSILMSLGWISEPVDFLGSVMGTRSLVGLMNFLMWFGNTTIMLMAAIMGIDSSLYEAALVDGANRFQRMTHITLPGIVMAISINLILSLSGILNAGFDQIFNLYSVPVYDVADIIDTYVYRIGITDGEFGIATALGLVKSLIGFLLILIVNKVTNKLGGVGVW